AFRRSRCPCSSLGRARRSNTRPSLPSGLTAATRPNTVGLGIPPSRPLTTGRGVRGLSPPVRTLTYASREGVRAVSVEAALEQGLVRAVTLGAGREAPATSRSRRRQERSDARSRPCFSERGYPVTGRARAEARRARLRVSPSHLRVSRAC